MRYDCFPEFLRSQKNAAGVNKIWTTEVMRQMKLDNGGILFEQRKAQKDPKKFHGIGVNC